MVVDCCQTQILCCFFLFIQSLHSKMMPFLAYQSRLGDISSISSGTVISKSNIPGTSSRIQSTNSGKSTMWAPLCPLRPRPQWPTHLLYIFCASCFCSILTSHSSMAFVFSKNNLRFPLILHLTVFFSSISQVGQVHLIL